MSNILKIGCSVLLLYNQYICTENKQNNIEQINNKIENKISNEQNKTKKNNSTLLNKINNITIKINKKISTLFSSTGSISIRFFASLILGLLLSLTPCIFPMIPITVGILQINSSTSKIRGFFTSLSYTLGISLTFAIFGFIVTLGSHVFGSFQGSIWTILPLAILLIYFGLSMFDFYEIKIPKFLQPKSTSVKQGSYLSAFLFGTISGTVASPCLSPGLALILDYVSQLSSNADIFSYLEGFLLLFVFGIGSSLPLLIIGTFSSSLNFMPKAGPWMLEVKKIIGIMLIVMAFYHISKLQQYFPWHILYIVITIAFISIGIYYIKNIKKTDSSKLKFYKILTAALLIIGSIVFGIYSNLSLNNKKQDYGIIWLNNFDQALEKAQLENKLLFIDIGSSFCAICKTIDNTIFKNPNVIKTIDKYYIPLKINYDIEQESFEKIKNLFGPIKGFPSYIITNKDTIIKKMGSELGNLDIDNIINIFKEPAKIS